MASSCPTCQQNKPQRAGRPQLAQSIQWHGTYPGEDRQMDFTQMSVSQGYTYLLVMIDTFTWWIEGFPTWTEKAEEVVKRTAPWNHYEIWWPQVIKSDNGTPFTSKVIQRVSKALGIIYYLLCAWRPQSSGKVERANQFLKSVIKKKDNSGDLPGMERGFTNSSPLYSYCP